MGFPGETLADFQASLAFVERCGFSALHVFPYSRRPGTPAAGMADQVPSAEKKRRAREAGELAHALQGRYLEGLVGRELEVLFEEAHNGVYQGHAPNYVLVKVPTAQDLHNQVRTVRVQTVEGGAVTGTLAN